MINFKPFSFFRLLVLFFVILTVSGCNEDVIGDMVVFSGSCRVKDSCFESVDEDECMEELCDDPGTQACRWVEKGQCDEAFGTCAIQNRSGVVSCLELRTKAECDDACERAGEGAACKFLTSGKKCE